MRRPSRCRPTSKPSSFDLDGVNTDTATNHAAAWKSVFESCLAHW
jgi:hypothetical protein